MARLPRLELAGVAPRVVQRGNNRLPCFLDDDDRLCCLRFLREALLPVVNLPPFFGLALHVEMTIAQQSDQRP